MQREMQKAVQSIEFIKNAVQKHPELYQDGMALLHQVLAVMPAVVTGSAAPGLSRDTGDGHVSSSREN